MTDKTAIVQGMQDYIDIHLNERITLTALAEAVHYSPFYCARVFKEITGFNPGDYIRRLKLSRSALRLRDEGCKVIDLAYDLGYDSVDGFQRAFRREFGKNPHEYSESPTPLVLFTPYGVKFRHIWKENTAMENVASVFIQVIDKPARKVIIKRGITAQEYMKYCDEVGCDIWETLVGMKSISSEPVCLWLPDEYIKEGTSKYVQGVEVETDYLGDIPEGFDVIELPAAKYLMFQSEPYPEEDYCNAIGALQTAMNRYDPSLIGYKWDDTNPRIQLAPIGERGYIELRAVAAK